MELAFDGLDVGVDVGVVVFEVVQNGGARAVVNELGALVEERRVVFVRLHHKMVPRAEPCTNTKVRGDTAHQKTRFEARMLQNPRHHAGSGGLAMRAGHRNDPTPAQHVFG